MIRMLFTLLLLAVAGVLGYATQKPDEFSVQRSLVVKASPEKVFPFINNQKKWAEWSPWEKMDVAMMKELSGPESGVGSIYKWRGNSKVGAGRSEIVESIPSRKVAFKLEMAEPFEAKNDVQFTLAPKDGGTEVTWVMKGKQTYIAKVMGIVFDCEKMAGRQFEDGLVNLKALAEK